jgi:signal transduction histidine kinase
VRARVLPVVLLALVAGRSVDAQPPASGPATKALPVLTTIKAIRTLSQDDSARGYPVRVRGIVTHFDEQADVNLIIHDGELGQFVVPPPPKLATAAAWQDLRRGDLIEIEGHTVRGGFAPNLEPRVIRKIGQTPLPQPKIIPFASMLTGRHDCDYVEVVGVVQRAWRSSDPTVHNLFMDVAFEEGVVRAAFWDFEPQDFDRLIDARVRLEGNVGSLFGRTEQLRGVSLFVGHTTDITVLESPPDPFTTATRTIKSIYNYSSAGEVKRRIRVRGVVTGYVPGHPVEVSDFTTTTTFRYVRNVLYVDDGTGGARIETEQNQHVTPGTVVDVAGFPGVTPGKPILTHAIFKVAGKAAQPAAVAITGTSVLTPDYDAALVRMEAHFLSMRKTPTERILVLKVGESVFDANVDGEPGTEPLERLRPGSIVAVTGVYSYQWGPPPAFRLFLRSVDDVRVIAAAPWWTLRHTAVMAFILALGAGVAFLWIRTTNRRKRQQYQAVLTERSRVARELHDTLEQGLAGISLQLEAVAGSLEESPDYARRSLEVARQMLRYSQEEARRSVMDLRAQALESRDLAGALMDLAQQMTQAAGAEAHVEIQGSRRRLDASVEHHLLRIGLEALTNALKHSGGRNIDIVLRFGPDAVELMVQDDGRGLVLEPDHLPGGHFGLYGIRERVDKMGGIFHVTGTPGTGTRLTVTVPSRRASAPEPVSQPVGELWPTS